MPIPQIKNEEKYQRLRKQGESKEKAARIANAGKSASRKGGQANRYEERTYDELRERASEVGIAGRSKMTKRQLVAALRNH